MSNFKRRVLHVADAASGGGAESVFRDTILALKEGGSEYDHYVACRAYGGEAFKIDYPFPSEEMSPLKRLVAQIFSLKNYKFLEKCLDSCKPDIIHLQNYGHLSPSVLKAIVNYRRKNESVKVIHTVHTFEYICSHHAAYDYKQNRRCTDCAGRNYKFKVFYRGCSRLGFFHSLGKGIASLVTSYYIARNAIDHWIAPSIFLKSLMTSTEFKEENISLIRNPAPVSNGVSGQDHYSLKTKDFEFIYFGRFSEEKNIECLIDAFSLLVKYDRSCKLTLIGKGNELELLKERCKYFGILDKVEFIQFLPKEQLLTRLQRAHVAVMASKCYENAPIAALEAIMVGLIPIVADHGGMRETVRSLGVGVLFKSDDSEDLAYKMGEVKERYESYLADLSRGKAIIESEYNADNYSSKLTSLYSQVEAISK